MRLILVCSLSSAVGLAISAPAARTSPRLFCCRTASPVLAEAPGETEIRWLPPIDPNGEDIEPSEGGTVMPLFPLGVTYLPFTTPVLNIFEPRYRAMYNDILFSGARRFMVCNVDGDTGRLAETGVIFYLDELKEVSEQTADRVKYVGSHSVIGRVNLVKVLNPSVAGTRETYLKAEVTELVDDDVEESLEELEADCQKLFEELVDVQSSLGEEPRFTAAVKSTLSFTRGERAANWQWAAVPAFFPRGLLLAAAEPGLRACVRARWCTSPRPRPAPLSVCLYCLSVCVCLSLSLTHTHTHTPLVPFRLTRVRDPVLLLLAAGSGSEDKTYSGDDKGLWGTVVLWQQFLEQRASVVGQKMQVRGFQRRRDAGRRDGGRGVTAAA